MPVGALQQGLQHSVPLVLDRIVWTSRQELPELGPVVANLCLHLDQNAVFLLSPLSVIDIGVQVIQPSAESDTG